MVNYKLTYFPIRALGEPARLILHYAKQPFEDNRVKQEDWPAIKPSFPYGQVPVLEVDGKVLAQSYAIYRYLARQFGLAGKDDWEAAKIDEIADFVKDISNEARPWFIVRIGRAEGDLAKLEADVFVPAADKTVKALEKELSASGSGFLVPSGVTWGDFLVAERLYSFDTLKPGFLDSRPKLKEYVARVYDLPQIKDYIASRPKTDV